VNVPIVKAYINQLKDIYADADKQNWWKWLWECRTQWKLSAMKSMKMIGHKSKS
jgi:hypothetical protein